MIPFLAIVGDELANEVPKVPLAQWHDAIEHSALIERTKRSACALQFGAAPGVANDANADRPEQRFHPTPPLRVAIADQDPTGAENVTLARQASERLDHEGVVRTRCRAQHMDTCRECSSMTKAV